MDFDQGKTVIEKIKENYHQIFSAEKKVADFILENPEKAVNANVSELANYSDVSDATVIRLCKHIGYQGYYQLRIILSRDLGREQVVNDAKERERDTVAGLFQSFSATINALSKNLDEAILLECTNLIKNSTQTHLVAVGNTSPLALYMGFRLGRLGVKCTYNMIPEYFLNHINLADKTDCIVAISQSGSSKQVVQALELAKEKRLKIIAITGYQHSPVSSLADYVLLSNSQGQEFDYYKSYSHLNETAVIDALLLFITAAQSMNTHCGDKPEMIFSEYKL